MEIREVNVTYGATRKIDCERVKCARDAASFLRGVAPDNSREHVIALYLDGSHRPIAYSIISTGSATESVVHPREVFQRAVLVGAKSLIMAHNHPSQDLTPSGEDRDATRKILKAGQIIGIKLLDHIIFNDFEIYSFQEGGEI